MSRFASCALGERRFAALVDGDTVRPLEAISELGRETPSAVLEVSGVGRLENPVAAE